MGVTRYEMKRDRFTLDTVTVIRWYLQDWYRSVSLDSADGSQWGAIGFFIGVRGAASDDLSDKAVTRAGPIKKINLTIHTFIYNNCYILLLQYWEKFAMCSVGGGDFNLDIEQLQLERYKCNDCGNKFDSMGEKVVCPSCWSENVIKA